MSQSRGRECNDRVLNYYLARSNVNVEAFDKVLSLSECHRQESNARSKVKDVVSDAKECGTTYEMEITIERVHKYHP
jgi:hypothetical protein